LLAGHYFADRCFAGRYFVEPGVPMTSLLLSHTPDTAARHGWHTSFHFKPTSPQQAAADSGGYGVEFA
jgi:hypothetical protein